MCSYTLIPLKLPPSVPLSLPLEHSPLSSPPLSSYPFPSSLLLLFTSPYPLLSSLFRLFSFLFFSFFLYISYLFPFSLSTIIFLPLFLCQFAPVLHSFIHDFYLFLEFSPTPPPSPFSFPFPPTPPLPSFILFFILFSYLSSIPPPLSSSSPRLFFVLFSLFFSFLLFSSSRVLLFLSPHLPRLFPSLFILNSIFFLPTADNFRKCHQRDRTI